MNKMETKLKPCPWPRCRSTKVDYRVSDESNYITVECQKCSASGPWIEGGWNDEDKEKAAILWNELERNNRDNNNAATENHYPILPGDIVVITKESDELFGRSGQVLADVGHDTFIVAVKIFSKPWCSEVRFPMERKHLRLLESAQ